MDAKINYLKAKLSLSGKDKKSVNLKHDKPTGTGIGSGTKIDGKQVTMPKLSKEAQEFVDAKGMSAERVRTILGE